jgi:hypothetical protein
VVTAAVVNRAVSAGKVTPADAEAKVTEILGANDLGTAISALDALPPKVKTASKTGDLGAAKVQLVVAANDESTARRQERAVAVANEFEATNAALPDGQRRRIAHERAARKNPALFANSPGSAA